VDPRPYFASTSWADVERINATLCKAGGFESGPRAEGYEPAHALWEKTHGQTLTFLQAADLCRECHRLAPFLYLNGNTFASCARVALLPAMERLDSKQQTFSRAALGHYIAGTIDRSELIAIVPPVLGE
jgi:hypothetical protein